MGVCSRNMQSDPAEIKPAQCCIKLVFHLSYTMMHGSTKLKCSCILTVLIDELQLCLTVRVIHQILRYITHITEAHALFCNLCLQSHHTTWTGSDLEQGRIVVCTQRRITTYTCTIFRHCKKLTNFLLFHARYIKFMYAILI